MAAIDRINDICDTIKDFVGADKVDGKDGGNNETYCIYKDDEVLVINVHAWMNVHKYKINDEKIRG